MKKTLALGIIILLVGSGVSVFIIFLLMNGPVAELQFQWGLEVGDELLYEVKVRGLNNNASIPLPYVKFNNTQIRMRIVSLPNVTLLNSSEEMINVIGYAKTECEFANGSEIATDSRDGYVMNTSIPEILSRAIIPIDEWAHIDSYFPDDYGQSQYEANTYLSKTEQQWFYIGYYYFHIDFGYGWDANVSLSTGTPISVIQWENDPICIGYYSVILTLVEEM
jgi:hypothetical protein